MENKIEKEYNVLKKKHHLPDFKEIDSEFDISIIEDTNLLIKKICERINEKMEMFIRVLEELLQPSESFKSLHELRYLDEEDKKNAYAVYKKLMIYNREFLILVLSSDEKGQAGFIKKMLVEWKKIKGDLTKFIGKMKESWEIETNIKEDLGYLG